jgi:putative ABC transport system permease protein
VTPRIPRTFIALTTPRDDRALVLADLDERFAAIALESSPERARRWYWSQAIRSLPSRLRPDREAIRRHSWTGIFGDVRQSVRLLRRKPLYTLGVTGTLAMGLASAATVLSIAWNVWLAPMPFPDPDRVVRLFELKPPDAEAAPDAEPTRWRISPPLLEDLRATEWTTVRAVAGVARNMWDWDRSDRTTRLSALRVSPEAFDILGIAPLHGRVISNDEDAPEVVLTEAFWERAFGSDPGMIGTGTMRLAGVEHAVVGVVRLPVGYPGSGDIIARLSFDEDQLAEGMRGARYLDVIARVDDAYSVSEASAEMDRIVEGLGRTYANHAGWGGDAATLGDELLEPYRGVLALLLAAGVVFLLLAVSNVAGLVAARTLDGRRDRAVRLALGASDRRLLRGSAAESALLSGLSATGALLGAYWLLGPIRALIPAEIPRVELVGLTPGLIVGIVVVALASGVGVGALGYVLSRGVRPSATAPGLRTTPGSRGRGAIVVGQVALTTLLSTAGVVILAQMADLRSVDLGFDPEGVVSTQVMLTGGRYPTPEARLTFWRELLARGGGRGVDLAVGTSPPMAGVNMPWGYRADPTADQAFAQYHIVSPAYFRLMGIDLIEGRTFTDDDREGSAPVVIVSRHFAETNFPGESAVGREVVVVADMKEIVGVVETVRHFGPGSDAPEDIYAPLEQDPWPHAQIIAQGDAGAMGAALSTLVAEIDPGLGVPPLEPYERFVAQWFAAIRLQVIIVGILAAIGTVLATLGLYALVAYRVLARSREIGIRLALGATGKRMFSDVVRQGAFLAASGIVVGIAAWYLFVPSAAALFGDPVAIDPRIPVGVAFLVGVVSLVACAVPARRSVAVDPAITLRTEEG